MELSSGEQNFKIFRLRLPRHKDDGGPANSYMTEFVGATGAAGSSVSSRLIVAISLSLSVLRKANVI